MQTARGRRTIVTTAGSAVAHLVVLAILAFQAPVLRIPDEPSGPPQAIIPILILPRTPPSAGAKGPPAPIRLHRRPQRNLPDALPVAPLTVPAAAQPAAAPRPAAPVAIHPAPMPEGPRGDVRAALRRGPVGCSNATAAGLNRAERDLCDEALGTGAKDTEFIPPGVGMTAAKRALLDQDAAAKAARKAAAERPGGPPAMVKPEPADYDGEPYTSGAGASAVGPITHKPSTRAARKLGRLPP